MVHDSGVAFHEDSLTSQISDSLTTLFSSETLDYEAQPRVDQKQMDGHGLRSLSQSP